MVTRSDTLCRSAGESQLFLTWHRRSYRARATGGTHPLGIRGPEAQSAFHWIDLTLRRGRAHARTNLVTTHAIRAPFSRFPVARLVKALSNQVYAILSTLNRAVARRGDQDRCLSPVSAANRLS